MENVISNLLQHGSIIQVLSITVCVLAVVIIQLRTVKEIGKLSEKTSTDLEALKKQLEVQNTVSSQFNGHFGSLDNRLKSIEEISTLTSRDISAMSDGINAEVGVGKAIELARGGASVEDILAQSNLKQDQIELIVKFHGKKDF